MYCQWIMEFSKMLLWWQYRIWQSILTQTQFPLWRLYAKLYPDFESQILDGQVYISYTFRKYSVIHWHGKILSSNLNKNAKNCLVMASPHFDFTSSVGSGQQFGERLAEVDHFLTHSLILLNNSQPLFHLFARVKWPMMHSQHEKYGNPVKVWYRNLYEYQNDNNLVLASNISSWVVFAIQSDHGEPTCVTVSVINAWLFIFSFN